MPIWKINFCSMFLRLSVLPRWRGKATNRHVFLRMVREVEMSREWFRNVFIVNLNISKVFAETITQSATRFADVYFHAKKVYIGKMGRRNDLKLYPN